MLHALGYALATGLLGIILVLIGVFALDVATPGKLPDQMSRNKNAAVVVSARLLAVAGIAFTTIWTNADKDLPTALWWTFVFGIIGIVIQTAATVVLSLAYRGAEHVFNQEGELRPLAIVLAAAQISAALIVIASIA